MAQSLAYPPQPQNVADLLAHRVSAQARSLNDDVDDIFVRLWETEAFRLALAAVHSSQTVEGSFAADDHVAAEMIRKYAQEHHFAVASISKLAAITFSLHIVSRRYGQARNQRRNLVHGEQVKMTDDAAE